MMRSTKLETRDYTAPRRRWYAVLCSLPAAILAFPPPAGAVLCPATVTPNLVENFLTTAKMDDRTTLQGWGTGSLRLPLVYTASARVRSALHKPITAGAAIDVDNDGDDDLIGVTEWRKCRLEVFLNDGSGNFTVTDVMQDDSDDDLEVDDCGTEAMLRTGDITGDGLKDVIYAGQERIPWEGWLRGDGGGGRPIRLYRNRNGLDDTFDDQASTLRLRDIRWHWSGGAMALTHWNDDTIGAFATGYNRLDAVVASSTVGGTTVSLYHACHPSGLLADCPESTTPGLGWNSDGTATPQNVPGSMVLIADAGFATPIASGATAATPFDNSCPAPVSRGISTVMAEDFDNDGDTDILLGSISEANLRYFENTGSNTNPEFFPDNTVSISFGMGAAYGVSGDFNNDGWADFVVAGDPIGCGAADGRPYLFINDRRGGFRPNPVAMGDLGTDIDWMTKIDVNNDGVDDIALGQNDYGAPLEAGLMVATAYYHVEGSAYSTVLSSNDPTTDTIVSANVDAFQAVLNGGEVSLHLSNNGGRDWEPVSAAELAGTTPHYFSSYGAELRWRLDLNAPTVTPGGAAAAAWPAAVASPVVTEITLSYSAVLEPVRFTRSGLAEGVVDNTNGTDRTVLYSASSLFPGFEATVRTYDIDDCSGNDFAGRVDTAVCTLKNTWLPNELRDILAVKSPGSRTLYTNDAGSRVTLTTPLSGMSTNIQNILGTTSDDDFNFVKNGMTLGSGSSPKLYDIGHSTPVFVGPPRGDEEFLGGTYAAFKAGSAATRTKVLYVAANDGMLHAIDAQTGDELWAFTPANLLGKLQEQRAPDNSYQQDYFIDGPLTVRDVYNGSSWRTILIAGQARGSGRYGANYYTAIDVTDPASPTPMWEFSSPWQPGAQTCDGDICELSCSIVASGDTCTRDCGRRGYVTVRSATSASVSSDKVHLNESHAAYPTDGYIRLAVGTSNEEVLPYEERDNSDDLEFPSGVSPKYSHSSPSLELVHPSAYVDDSAQIVIEAEDLHREIRRESGLTLWPIDQGSSPAPVPPLSPTVLTTLSGNAGGGRYIFWDAPLAPNCQPDGVDLNNSCGIELRYRLRLQQGLSWSTKARGYFTDGGLDSDSVIIGIGDDLASLHTNSDATKFIWAVNSDDDNESLIVPVSDLNPDYWVWESPGHGAEELVLAMREDGVGIDQVALFPSSLAPLGGPSGGQPLNPTCAETCSNFTAYSVSCAVDCSGDVNAAWPECGGGKKCCAVPGSGSDFYCETVGTTCGTAPPAVLGETWSPPAVGRFKIGGTDRWLAVFASGYDNQGYPNTGRAVFAVDVFSGAPVARWDFDDIAQSGSNPSTIDNTVPGGVALVDMDDCAPPADPGCGYVDRMYVGDLEGRLWKMDTSFDGVLGGGGLVTNWASCVLFDAGVQGTGRWWAPIITTPAVAFVGAAPATQPYIYFGTGGDDRAPTSPDGTSGPYRFYGVRDPDAAGTCLGSPKTEVSLTDPYEWIVGDGKDLNGDPLSASDSEGVTGDRYWADPVVVNNALLVMASLNGQIEAVDPCATTIGGGVAYAYALTRITIGTPPRTYPAGGQILRRTDVSKVRQAARVSGVANLIGDYGVGVAQRKVVEQGPLPFVFVQSAADPNAASTNATAQPPVLELFSGATLALSARSALRIIRWREVTP